MAETPWRRGNRTLQVDASVEHTESSTVPGGAPSAGTGKFWVRDDSPNVPVFTDDAGTDHVLNDSGGGSSILAGQGGLQYENAVFYADTLNPGSLTTDSAWTDIVSDTEATAGTGITLVDGYWDFSFSGIFDFGTLASVEDVWSGGGTLCMWVNIQGTGTNFGGYIVDKSDNSTDGWVVSVNNGATQVRLFAWFSGGLAQWSFTHGLGIPTGFFHLAIVYDTDDPTNDPTFYVNGVAQSFSLDFNSSGTYDSDVAEPLKIGGAAASNYFDGQMRGVWLYDNAFTVDQINSHYRVTAPPIEALAAPLDSVLVAGNTTGGNDIIISSGDNILSADQTSGGATDSFALRTGDVSGGSGNAGNLTLRGGDTSTSGGGGGDVTIRGGASGNTGSGEIFIQGGDPTPGGTGSPGRLVMRAGDRDGNNSNGTGAVAGLKAGNSLNSTGGNLFLRSGAPDGSSTSGGTGDIFISTSSQVAGPADPFGNFELRSDTGSIVLSTETFNFPEVNLSGNIEFIIGSVYATTGNNPGDFTFTGGDIIENQNFAAGTEMNITLGDGTATISGGGGSFSVTAGNNTRAAAATNTTGVAGGIFLTAGTSALTGASAFGGQVEITAGDGVGTNTNGGSVTLTAGAGTGTEDAGSVVLTPGIASGAGADGFTDLTSGYLRLQEQASVSGAVAGKGLFWVRDDVPNVPMYTDDTGTDFVLNAGGAADLQEAYEGGNTISTSAPEGPLTVSGTEAISLSSTGNDVTIETASTTVPGNVIIAGGGATAGPGGDVTLTGGDVTAGAGGVGGAITAAAGDSFGAFDGGAVDISAGQGGATNNGGDALVQGGAGGATSGNGGRADLFGGDATTDGQGGVAAVLGGSAAGNNAGGSAGVTGGTGSGTGAGGAAVVFGGTAGATGSGGAVQLQGAAGGSTSGAGGAISINAGNGNGASQAGGSISLNGGNSTNAITGGAIVIKSGDSVTGSGGAASLQGGDATNATTGDGGSVLVQGGQGPEGGGNATLTGGASDDTGNGGTAFVLGGNVTSGAGNGGDVEITGGDGLGSLGLGGSITLTVGDTTGTNSAGQDVTVTAGDGNGTADGGNIILNPGSATGTGTDGEVTINGKLTVTGLIDPTGLVLDEQSSVPFSTTAGMGTLWVRNDSPNTLQFTDDAGTTRDVINNDRSVWYGFVDQQDTTQVYIYRSGEAAVTTTRNNNTGFVAPADILEHIITLKPTATGAYNNNIVVRVYRNNGLVFTNVVAVNTSTTAAVTRDITAANISAGDRFDISFTPQTTGAGNFLVAIHTMYDWNNAV